jgi:hypothetical protein
MKRRLALFLGVTLFFVWTHRLPGPIVEEQPSPSVASEQKKAKSTKAAAATPEPNAGSKSIQRFIGTWKGYSSKDSSSATHRRENVLIIEDGGHRASLERTATLTPTDHWKDVPKEYSKNPAILKWRCVSTDLKLDGSNLTIRWEPFQLVEWSREMVSTELIQKLKTKEGTGKTVSVYTLHGNQLTREFDPKGGVTYTRAK